MERSLQKLCHTAVRRIRRGLKVEETEAGLNEVFLKLGRELDSVITNMNEKDLHVHLDQLRISLKSLRTWWKLTKNMSPAVDIINQIFSFA